MLGDDLVYVDRVLLSALLTVRVLLKSEAKTLKPGSVRSLELLADACKQALEKEDAWAKTMERLQPC